MVDMRHRAKLRPDQSNSYGDMTSFSIFFVFLASLGCQSMASYEHNPHDCKKISVKGQSVQTIEWIQTDLQLMGDHLCG